MPFNSGKNKNFENELFVATFEDSADLQLKIDSDFREGAGLFKAGKLAGKNC